MHRHVFHAQCQIAEAQSGMNKLLVSLSRPFRRHDLQSREFGASPHNTRTPG